MALPEATTTTNPSYEDVVEPLLRAHDGDPSALLAAYPNFDVEAVLEKLFELPYLHEACENNHFHAVRGLVQCGARLQRVSWGALTPLYLACWGPGGRADLVVWLLSHKDARDTVNWVTSQGCTPLHEAAYRGSIALIRVLLKHGADLTLQNAEGDTPENAAWREGMKESALFLGEAAERAHAVLQLGEWRPHKQSRFPPGYRAAMRTLVVLAKARKPNVPLALDCERYPHSCLSLLPEELLQYLFAYITTPHVPDVWTKREKK